MELEVINKLFLELSQVATATTKREIDLVKQLSEVAVGKPYLKNRGDGVDGHYCIARKHRDGYHEFWNDRTKVWCSTGSVLELGK